MLMVMVDDDYYTISSNTDRNDPWDDLFSQVHLIAPSLISWYNINNHVHIFPQCYWGRRLLWIIWSKSSHLNRINSTWWWCDYYFHPCFIIIFYLLHSSFTTTELQGSCSIYSCFFAWITFYFYLPIYTYFLFIHDVYLYTFCPLFHSTLLQRAGRVLYEVYLYVRMNVPFIPSFHT